MAFNVIRHCQGLSHVACHWTCNTLVIQRVNVGCKLYPYLPNFLSIIWRALFLSTSCRVAIALTVPLLPMWCKGLKHWVMLCCVSLDQFAIHATGALLPFGTAWEALVNRDHILHQMLFIGDVCIVQWMIGNMHHCCGHHHCQPLPFCVLQSNRSLVSPCALHAKVAAAATAEAFLFSY